MYFLYRVQLACRMGRHCFFFVELVLRYVIFMYMLGTVYLVSLYASNNSWTQVHETEKV